jgi:glutathione peroxidase
MSIYQFSAQRITGESESLERYRGNVVLIVNVASRCGLTPQYAVLERLYRSYRDAGLVILGFPCNQFNHQEPGDDQQIASFCSLTYDVTFPMFAKIDVNGPGAHPLYAYLRRARPGLLGSEAIKMNFTKFLIDRTGEPVKRFSPLDVPERLVPDIERALAGMAATAA